MKVDRNIIKAINEEITNFDFLNNEKHEISLDDIRLMENEDFQKQFIVDFLTGKSDKYEIIDSIEVNLVGDWENINDSDIDNKIGLECNVDLEYSYDINKEPIKFSLLFESDNISVSNGDINWDDVNVTLFTPEGDEIKFTAFEKAPDNIRDLFIREFIYDVFKEENGIELPLT
jgi:hypothetical protein